MIPVQSTPILTQKATIDMQAIRIYYDKLLKDYKKIEAKMFLHVYTRSETDE